MTQKLLMVMAALLTMQVQAQSLEPESRSRESNAIARGRYLVQITGCNDCHTPGYMQASGKVAEAQWLTGDGLGWRGPWGTTYGINLRLYFSSLSEEQWLAHARRMEPRPPMP